MKKHIFQVLAEEIYPNVGKYLCENIFSGSSALNVRIYQKCYVILVWSVYTYLLTRLVLPEPVENKKMRWNALEELDYLGSQ